jgi:hypothetical protein
VGIPILALLNWGIFQFEILPKMPEQERKDIYAGWMSTPYPYVISLAFVCAAIWFAFSCRGRFSTHGRRIAAFGMALATVWGMLLMLVIRSTWHI